MNGSGTAVEHGQGVVTRPRMGVAQPSSTVIEVLGVQPREAAVATGIGGARHAAGAAARR